MERKSRTKSRAFRTENPICQSSSVDLVHPQKPFQDEESNQSYIQVSISNDADLQPAVVSDLPDLVNAHSYP